MCNLTSCLKYIKRNILTMHGPLKVKCMETNSHIPVNLGVLKIVASKGQPRQQKFVSCLTYILF